MATIEHRYSLGAREALARGLDVAPGDYPIAVLEAHPLPITEGVTVAAEVNHGRWIARCPFCSGAEVVTAAYPIFWCDCCEMGEVDGQAARVVFPDALAEIEAELVRRPLPHRCYRPGEIEEAFEKREQPVDVTVGEWLRAESVVYGWRPGNVADRIVAKAILWGSGAVAAEIEDLDRHGAAELERRFHAGGNGGTG